MSITNFLDTKVTNLAYVGSIYRDRLARLNIETVKDLLYHIPFRYDDYTQISDIAHLNTGETVTIKATVLDIKNIFTKTGKRLTEATVYDDTGQLKIIWFNQIFLTKVIKPNEVFLFSGKADWFARKIAMISPSYEIVKSDNIHTGRLVPVYPETEGISSKWLRARIAGVLKFHSNDINDYLPEEILKETGLMDLKSALSEIHFPKNVHSTEKARERIAFDELFSIQIASQLRRKTWEEETVGNKFNIDKYLVQINEFIAKLPFKLTQSQFASVSEILADLKNSYPMNRLLEGDVGSGKTVVGAVIMYAAYLNGYQSALMAPTEILANQHYKTISKLLSPFGIKVKLLTSTSSKKEDLEIINGNYDVIVGTHSLLNDNAKYNKLGLIIIDEQQRFGVEQREKLKMKGYNPHLLAMTATPIPRTIALTMYGELNMSVLTDMPNGVRKIKTWVVPNEKREKAYEWMKIYGKKIFIVCPLIEESESLNIVKAVKKEYLMLKKIFNTKKVGLLHGKMTGAEKEKILNDYRTDKLDVLVSTPIIEVGIDIPEANIIVIEAADRFGLSQLHQLRGRVGRAGQEAFCLLFTESTDELAIKRLKSLEFTFIGPKLAEIDLELRGPGEILGFKQHGFVKFKAARFGDTGLILKSRKLAEDLIRNNTITRYPQLSDYINKISKAESVAN